MIAQWPPLGSSVSAGEPSGDLHGAGVVSGAPRSDTPTPAIEALGGPRMAAAGAEDPLSQWRDSRPSGWWRSSPSSAPTCGCCARSGPTSGPHRYDLVILIDYPGFHVRVAESARQAGTKVLYGIAPSSGPGGRGGPAASPRLSTGWRSCSRSNNASSAASGPERLCRPPVGGPGSCGPREPRPGVRLGVPADSRVLGIFPGSRPAGDRPPLAPVPRGRPAACSTRDAATACSWRARRAATIPIRGRSRFFAATRSRSSPRPMRRSPSPARRRSRPHSRTCRWWSPTRCIR